MRALREQAAADTAPPFPSGDGQMGALARWQDLFVQAPGFVCILRGPEHVYEFCNPAYFELVGRTDLIGRAVADALPWAVEQGFSALLDEVYRSGSAHTGRGTPVSLPGAGAAPRYVDFVYQPIRDEAGRVNGIFVLGSDVTEQRSAQEALRGSEQRLRIASDAASLGIYELDVETGRVSWDARMRGLWGIAGAAETVDVATMTACVHPQDRAAKEAATARALTASGDGRYRTEYRVVNAADGITRWVQAYGQAVFEGGLAKRLIGAVQDISERKLAESRRDEFLATLGHELRNPLAPIGNSLQMLQRQGGHGELADSALAVIDRQFHHVVRLIDDLLDVVRIQHGRFELRKARVALHDVLEQALETAAPSIQRGAHRVEQRLPAEPVWLDGDAVRLAQVLSNLLINACKYSDEGSPIDVSAECDGHRELRLRVRDRGIGIEPGYLDRVFDAFSQAELSLHRAEGGLGIGLALARGIVELHGGRISAHSAGRGLGSSFEVVLPLAPQRQELWPPPRAPQVARKPVPETAGDPAIDDRLAGKRLLLVEDNHDHAETLSVLLGLYGAAVRWAPDGPAALALAEEQRPQTVLLDLGLPGLDGYEVCRRLRATPWGRPMQIIALTGWGQPADRERTRRAGFDAHLLKPVEFEALLRLLAP